MKRLIADSHAVLNDSWQRILNAEHVVLEACACCCYTVVVHFQHAKIAGCSTVAKMVASMS
jgi:hypothetical protein